MECGFDISWFYLQLNEMYDYYNYKLYTQKECVFDIVKASHLEIIDLHHSVEELSSQSNQLKAQVEAQDKELCQRKLRIEELEEMESLANQSVEDLMMDIVSVEEEIARWKVAAEQEDAAGRSVEREFLAQLSVLRQELDEMKQAMVESEKMLKFKEETAVAAMSARDAVEKSLRLADLRASRLRERLEELSHQFEALDSNKDGVLSRSELRKAFESLRLIESHFGTDVTTPPEQLTQLYDSIFEGFDCDRSGTIDIEEFRAEMKKIMLAVADGLGFSPIEMVIENDDDSFLKQAADLEASKIAAKP